MSLKLRTLLLAGACLSATTGCAIHQKVSPATSISAKQICIVENPDVKAGFVDSYRKALVAKGFQVRTLPKQASLIECPVTSTYTANWRWDLATYMAYAEIKVYQDARPVGQAIYDSRMGGANLGKFISAENKIQELVEQLFPSSAGL